MLGRFFTIDVAIHEGHELVTRGPYRMTLDLGVAVLSKEKGTSNCEGLPSGQAGVRVTVRPGGTLMPSPVVFASILAAAWDLGLETKNEILRTTDGGRTWVRVPLGVPHGLTVRVSDVQVFADGHAWLAGSTGVLVSRDFGATWCYVADEAFEGVARCNTVCFRTPELGVVGAGSSVLHGWVTTAGCVCACPTERSAAGR